MKSAIQLASREQQLEKALANALEQVKLHERLQEVLNNDIECRDAVIAAQNGLIKVMKSQINLMEINVQSYIAFPAPRTFGGW